MLTKANINWNCKQITKMANNETLRFDNIIQRSYVWERERKSELIHSIVEGYPIPPFYARRVDGKIYDFLDGKQRVDAIRGYINDEYHLIGIDDVELEEGKWIDINGKTFSELPEEISDRITSYSLTIYYYENITPEQTRIMFKKLNNGKPLSTKERNIANCVDIVNISEIGKHEFFQKAITEKALKTRKQIPMIVKMHQMLTESVDDISFESKDFNEIMSETKISAEEKDQINKILDLMLKVVNTLDEEKVAKVTKRKFLTETNLISLAPIFDDAINNGKDDPRLLALFIADAFTTKKTISVKYADACSAGSAKNRSIAIRHNEAVKAWNSFLDTNPTIPESSQNPSEAHEDTVDDEVENVASESTEEPEGVDMDSKKETKEEYKYGMRLRGFSPMCQPMDGLLRREDDLSGDYHDILVYSRELSSEELNQYELDLLN